MTKITLKHNSCRRLLFELGDTCEMFRSHQRLSVAASSRTLGPQLIARCWVGSATATAAVAVAATWTRRFRGRGALLGPALPPPPEPQSQATGPGRGPKAGRGQGEGAEPVPGGPRHQFVSSAVAGPSLAALDSDPAAALHFPTTRASLSLSFPAPAPESLHSHSTARAPGHPLGHHHSLS
jgi:hypothetical protein